MLPNVGGGELVILLIVLLLLFGAKRIPELARGLGTGIREFRRGASGEKDEVRERDKEGGKTLGDETDHGNGVHEESVRAKEEDDRAERQP